MESLNSMVICVNRNLEVLSMNKVSSEFFDSLLKSNFKITVPVNIDDDNLFTSRSNHCLENNKLNNSAQIFFNSLSITHNLDSSLSLPEGTRFFEIILNLFSAFKRS